MPRSSIASVVVAGLVLVACIGDDPDTSSSGGATPASAGGSRSIGCDAKSTCTGADLCCGVGIDWIGASCKADCGGAYSLSCDEASDCDAGQVCCYTTDGGARAVASFCAASCRPEKKEAQLCKIGGSGECKTGSCTSLTQFSPSGLAHCD